MPVAAIVRLIAVSIDGKNIASSELIITMMVIMMIVVIIMVVVIIIIIIPNIIRNENQAIDIKSVMTTMRTK